MNATYQISWRDACPAFNRRGGFRAFRGFHGFLPFFAVLALFAVFLAAASPAPAQTTMTLLDIKSPATADPPSTSLLTVSDAGDLWIKGALVEYAYPGLITLDPAKQYWTLRDSDGNILWALEVYNPSTGISAGNLLTVGTFESYCYDAEQDDAIFRVKTTAGLTVLSLSPLGRLLATGLAPVRLTPTSTPPPPSYTPLTPDAYAPAPDFRDELTTYLNQVAQPPHNEIRCPIPQAQARIYFAAPSGNSQRQLHDVTNMSWRRRWSRANTTLADYEVRYYGLRCVNASDLYKYPESTPAWIWIIYDPETNALDLAENDLRIYWDGQASTWMPIDGQISSWSVSDSSTDLTSQSLVEITAALHDSPQDPDYGDADTTARSEVFLYAMDFTRGHPAPGSYSRNTNDTRRVNVGCRLLPEDMPTTWVQRIELTLWDPAYVGPNGEKYHRRVFLNTESECTSPSFVGKPFISKMWDGKLYLDGVTTSTAYYTQASDFFMSATVYWNPAYPPDPLDPNYPDPKDPFYFKPWESESDEFPEPRVAFTVTGSPAMTTDTLEAGSQYTFSTVTNALPAAIASYQWDFQGKAFQTADHDRYTSDNLLTAAQKQTASVTTQFITGWKSSVSNTDLGTRTVQLAVTDTSQTLWTSTLRPYVMVHRSNNVRAKITFYHLAYEAQSVFSNGPYTEHISIFDPVTQTTRQYYFGVDFLGQIEMQGTGVPHKLRTQSGLTKEQGDDPLPQQRYIMYAPGNPGTYSFSAAARVVSQDGAHFYWDGQDDAEPVHGNHQHRSYFNRGVAYEITDVFCPGNQFYSQQTYASLAELVNARRGDFTDGDSPIQFTGSEITINDAGTFEKWQNRDIDEKHIDVFLEGTGNQGINQQQIFNRLGTVWVTVRRP